MVVLSRTNYRQLIVLISMLRSSKGMQKVQLVYFTCTNKKRDRFILPANAIWWRHKSRWIIHRGWVMLNSLANITAKTELWCQIHVKLTSHSQEYEPWFTHPATFNNWIVIGLKHWASSSNDHLSTTWLPMHLIHHGYLAKSPNGRLLDPRSNLTNVRDSTCQMVIIWFVHCFFRELRVYYSRFVKTLFQFTP